LFETLSVLILIDATAVLFPTLLLFRALRVLTLADAVAVLFPSLILVSSPLILIALHTHANFTRR
jgi:hypothetical protein